MKIEVVTTVPAERNLNVYFPRQKKIGNFPVCSLKLPCVIHLSNENEL